MEGFFQVAEFLPYSDTRQVLSGPTNYDRKMYLYNISHNAIISYYHYLCFMVQLLYLNSLDFPIKRVF